VKVQARGSSQRIQAKGIYLGAAVVRGPDWAAEYNEQDGRNIIKQRSHNQHNNNIDDR